MTFVTKYAAGIHLFYSMAKHTDTKAERLVIMISRLLRWSLGSLLIYLGYTRVQESYAWLLLVFGAGTIVTGFLRPTRCLDKNCTTGK